MNPQLVLSLLVHLFLPLLLFLSLLVHLLLHLDFLRLLLKDLLFCLSFTIKLYHFMQFSGLLSFPHLLELLYGQDFSFFLQQLLISLFCNFFDVCILKLALHDPLHIVLPLLFLGNDVLFGKGR